MKTLVLERPGALQLVERPTPAEPRPGHALLRVQRVGICGTDLHAYRGRQPFFAYPRVLGHELGVEIAALGPAQQGDGSESLELAVGMKCAVEPYLYCGECPACRRGKTNCCRSLQVLGVHIDGGMCEWLEVPVALLHPSPTLSLDALALVEMLCIGAHAVRRAMPEPAEKTLVIGAGPIGLATAQFARLAHADVAMMEVNPARLAFAQQHLGLEKTIVTPQTDASAANAPDTAGMDVSMMDRENEEAQAALHACFDGELPSLVLDATGNAASMMRAFRRVENGGRLVFVGLVQADITFHDPEFHRRELTLFSSRNADSHDFAHVIRRLESGDIDVKPWITHRSRPETLVDDFPGWLTPEAGVVKAMLEF